MQASGLNCPNFIYHTYFFDNNGNSYFINPNGTLYDSFGEICYLDSAGVICYQDYLGNIYYKNESQTINDSEGEIYNRSPHNIIHSFTERDAHKALEHNGQTYYSNSFGHLYTSLNEKEIYPNIPPQEGMKINLDCLKTGRDEGAFPKYLSDHSISVAEITVSGGNKESLPLKLFIASWNILGPCMESSKFKSHKSINNPWGIKSEPDFKTRLKEIGDKIISIIDQHENLGAFFLQEALKLSLNNPFKTLLKKRKWSFVRNKNLLIIFNNKILRHIEAPLNNVITKKKIDELMKVNSWKTPLENRFLLRKFCLLSENIPVAIIYLVNFHLEFINTRSRTNDLHLEENFFERIVRKVGTTTIFAGDTNHHQSKIPSIYLGDKSKSTTCIGFQTVKKKKRKDYFLVANPYPDKGLSFKEIALSHFTIGDNQEVIDFSDNPATLFQEPSQLFITRPPQFQDSEENAISKRVHFWQYSKTFLLEMKSKLFEDNEKEIDIPEHIAQLAANRRSAKLAKDYTKADSLRKDLNNA